MDNYYNTLGVKEFCTDQEEIKKAYRSQIKYFHPDLGNVSQEIAEAKTKQLNAAYDVLSDPQKKQKYDSQLRYEKESSQKTNNNNYSNQTNSGYYSNSAYRNTTYNNSNTYQGSYSNNAYRQNNSNTNNTYRGNYTYTNYSNSNRYSSRKNSSGGWKVFLGIAAFLFLISMCNNSSNSSSSYYNNSSNTTSNNNSYQATDQDANLTPVSITNGKILKYPSDERVAPLTIKTSGSNGYYIYLEDFSNSNGKNDMSFYVKGGNTVDIDVPLGKYKFYYCSGKTWYGTTNKFGSNTSYCKADDIFDFYVSGDYVYGHTVTLYTVANGNMETENISEGQFPG